MKFTKIFKSFLVVMSLGAIMVSCNDNDDNAWVYYHQYANALVTTKTANDGTFFLQVTDNTTMLPCNISKSPFDKEMRALINYVPVDKELLPNGDLRGCDMAVKVLWIDSIRTKMPVPDLAELNDATYGSDCVEIIDDWVTVAEDGYLTLRFRTVWGGIGKIHYVNLLTGVNPENPYEVELRHDAQGDVNGEFADALVAFNLNDLPDTGGQTVKLKLRWKSYSGEKTHEFDFCSRKPSGGELPVANMKRIMPLQ